MILTLTLILLLLIGYKGGTRPNSPLDLQKPWVDRLFSPWEWAADVLNPIAP